jgi:hypothetical protein
METGNAIHSVNERQLRNTHRKIASVRILIQQLLEEDFPYTQGKDLLEAIDELLERREKAISSVNPQAERAVVNRLCQESQETISHYLPLVGFVRRSTNIRNAFELYAPLLDTVRRALGDDAKLVISSEWEFSPYTLIPPRISGKHFVLIGLPASESENALAAPLAGHELGHNVWVSQELEEKYSTLAKQGFERVIKGPGWAEFEKHLPQIGSKEKVGDLLGQQLWAPAWTWCMSQLQELFCDSTGLLLFGESYLHAFAYLIAPAISMERSKNYPAIADRVTFLMRNAERLGLVGLPDYGSYFEAEKLLDGDTTKYLLGLSDEVRAELEEQIFADAEEVFATWGLPEHSSDETQRIYESFVALTPAIKASCLANIVNAGWRMYLAGFSDWDKYAVIRNNTRKAQSVLNDLILKSAEVFEIQRMGSAS